MESLIFSPSARSRTACVACPYVLGGGALLLAAGASLVSTDRFAWQLLPGALVPYLVLSGMILARIGTYHPHSRFGVANAVTLARAVLNCLLAGLLLEAALGVGANVDRLGWIPFWLASLSLCLDGIDGPLARRQGLVSRFGARFDIEVDALLLTLLAAAAFMLGKAGAWVLAIGGFHYAFLVARQFLPGLRRALPASMRRKVVCVLQGGALLIVSMPPVEPILGTWIAALALLALAWSFAVDIAWLALSREAGKRGVHA